MNKKIKILILGIGQSNFLNQLYGEINKRDSGFKFYINNYFDLSTRKVKINHLPYDGFYDFETQPIPKWKFRKTFYEFSKKRLFWQIVFFERSQKKSYKAIKSILISYTKAKYRVENFIEPLKMDIVHFHFCVPENLKEIYFLSSGTKSICSFWGSDLLRVTGASHVFYIKKALEKTTAITIQTPELAEILYGKYGKRFQGKLNILRFTLGIKILKNIDEYRENSFLKSDFKKRHAISQEKTIVALGHNGFCENNHFKMIHQIKNMPKAIVEKYVFILQLSYGGNQKYINSLKKNAELEEDLEIVVLTKFFNEKETALLRLVTDVLIQMPTTDALSAAMTEVLYAGNAVIAGAWLPYEIFGRNGIQIRQIEKFDDLPGELENFLIVKNKIKNHNINNAKAIQTFLFPECTTPPWIKLFKTLIS